MSAPEKIRAKPSEDETMGKNSMRMRRLGSNGLDVSALGLGCMG
jgi:hypothetical protein